MNLGRAFVTIALACVALAVCAAAVTGQVPEKINYQIMLTDDADTPLADQTLNVDFRIYAIETGGPTLWAESHTVTTNSIGVATVVLGETNALNIDFDVPLWLEVQVEDDILTPRRELLSAPYALHARSSDYAATTGSVTYADTAGYALATAGTDTALYAHAAGYADTAGYAMAAPCDTCDFAIAAGSAATATSAVYADTADYALAAPCDTCGYAMTAGSAGTATTAGSAADADSLGGVAAGDYAIASNYVTSSTLGDAGTINTPGNPVTWTKLKDVPSGFADGTDDTGGLDDAGVACYYTGGGTQVLTTYTPAISHSITVPAAGYVYVAANAQANCTHDTTSASRLLYGVAADSTLIPDGLDEEIQLDSTVPAGSYRFGISPSAVFPVASAGTYEFYLVASAYGTWYTYDVGLSLLYFPTAYGTVTGDTKVLAPAARDDERMDVGNGR